jgi:hypothetical protein
MNLAVAISMIIGGAAAALTVIGAYTSWVYGRGQHSGRAGAEREAGQRAQAEAAEKVEALKVQLAAIQGELNLLRPKHPRALPSGVRAVAAAVYLIIVYTPFPSSCSIRRGHKATPSAYRMQF